VDCVVCLYVSIGCAMLEYGCASPRKREKQLANLNALLSSQSRYVYAVHSTTALCVVHVVTAYLRVSSSWLLLSRFQAVGYLTI